MLNKIYKHKRFRALVTFLYFVCAIVTAVTLAFLLRFDFGVPAEEVGRFSKGIWIALATKLSVFYFLRRHLATWRFVGLLELVHIVGGQAVASSLFTAVTFGVIGPAFPRSIYVLDFMLCLLIEAASRIAVRAYAEIVLREAQQDDASAILIYGADAPGITLAREIRNDPALSYRVVGFLDDDPARRGLSVAGSTVLGGGREVATIVDRLRKRGTPVKEIVIAMPSVTGQRMREVLANCRAADVQVKTIPGVGELLSGKVLTSQLRSISVEDLLGREPVQLDESLIRTSLQNRVVMVTGGGGSIGSELCRQIAGFKPKRLIVFEQAESDLYRIQLELLQSHPDVPIVAAIGDIRVRDSVETIIRKYGVESIFHAAAYKHVPMMEAHLVEAARNNIFGTKTLVDAACRNGVGSFLMISSDKAVNPTNVMGLTKRVAELIVSMMPVPNNSSWRTKFVSVRFGNVLGSNGSVVPLFEKQISAGGPVTVTHPDMRRYFMTIREAVQLVLQASTMGHGSEIFVLDMGEPVRIVDLARNMIRLSGREPDTEIEIRYTGLRPGEKLYEELIIKGENVLPTYHEKIKIFQGTPAIRSQLDQILARLEKLLDERDETGAIRLLQALIPEYQPADHWRRAMDGEVRTARVSRVRRALKSGKSVVRAGI